MTLFAGIFNRRPGIPISDTTCDALKGAVSRGSQEGITVFKNDRACFVKWDINAYGEPAFKTDSDGAVSMLVGEPLLGLTDNAEAWQSRTKDLELLHQEWKRGEWGLLKRARGAFSAIHYQPESATLFLIADKLGIRPLYYYLDEQRVIFASALRILESLPDVPKEMDLRGVTEIAGLTFLLGDRTPYANTATIKAAQIVQVSEKTKSDEQYWRWDTITPKQGTEDQLLAEVFRQFGTAVARRLRNDSTTIASLSGGLDSRSIVAALTQRNVRIHTYNFAPSDSQDFLFGNEFARQVGTLHQGLPADLGTATSDYSFKIAKAWQSSKYRDSYPVERPRIIWSGEGGSVGFGLVHMSKAIVDFMRSGQQDQAIQSFLEQERAHVTYRLLKAPISTKLSGVLHRGIREELASIHCEDPGRDFYVFIMLNDQRRKLATHFESIDLHQLELQLPFFDSDFLASLMAVPIDLCLGHKFYNKFLGLFPPVVSSVPWQAYPGHEPCPIPTPAGVGYQWDTGGGSAPAEKRKRQLLKSASDVMRDSNFPHRILRKRYLQFITWLYWSGVRDYSYVLRSAEIYHKYYALSGGAVPDLE